MKKQIKSNLTRKQEKRLIKSLHNKIIARVREQVIIRDESTCQKCKQLVLGANRHLSHVIPVSGSSLLKYDIYNLKILCYHCHFYWWHKNPLAARDWFAKEFPERYTYLQERQETYFKWSLVALQEYWESLK